MTDPHEDKAFDEYLDGASPVSRRYAALESEEPPAALDAEILEAARRGAAPNVFPLKRPPRRWMAPVTLVAMIVLSFSLVMSIVFDTPVLTDDIPVTTITEADRVEREMQDVAAEQSAARPLAAPPARPQRPTPITTPDADAGRVGLAQKEEISELAVDVAGRMPGTVGGADAVESSARRLDAISPDTSGLLAGLRELVPAEHEADAVMAKESRQHRQDGMIARLETKTRPAEMDAQAPQASQNIEYELQRIIVMFEEGDDKAALDALENFSRSWPDHPASRLYSDWSVRE